MLSPGLKSAVAFEGFGIIIIIIIIIIISLFPYIDNKLHKSSISLIRFLPQVNIGKGEKAEAKLIISLPPSGVLEYKYKT